MPDRLKRSVTVAIYWKNGELVCENYRVRSRAAVNASTIEILNYFDHWRTTKQALKQFTKFSPQQVLSSIRQLTGLSLLVQEGSEQAERDAACELVWSSWLPQAGHLHFGCIDTPFESSEAAEREIYEAIWKNTRQPSFSKSYPGSTVTSLPPPEKLEADFHKVLFTRRTHREFSAEPMALSALATLLFDTWGVTGKISSEYFGELPLKTSPSGGARHPIEAYVCALKVVGLEPGIYHYISDKHILEKIRDGFTPDEAVEYCAGQSWAGGAAALFVMTAVFERAMWKYPFPRAYRVVLADAGHLCQTFCLVANALGLGPFETMALKDSRIEAALGIDGLRESALYLAGAGLPA